MAEVAIRVYRAVPNAPTLVPILRQFERQGEGVVTTLRDGMLGSLAEAVGHTSPLEVWEWSKLVYSVAQLSGEEVRGLAPQTLVEAAVAMGFSELGGESPFVRSKSFAGAHRSVLRALQLLNQWGWTAERLREVADRSDAWLRDKLLSLASIGESRAKRLLRLGRQTHTEQMMLCLDVVPELDGFVERLLIFAGDDVTPLQDKWIRWLASHGVAITIVIDDHPFARDLFHRSLDWSKSLPVEAIGTPHLLAGNLFATTQTEDLPLIEATIEISAEPLAEAEWAIRRAQAVVENGQSATIVTRQLGLYAPLLECASERLGIQLRMMRTAPLLTNSFARLTLQALRFCSGKDVRLLSSVLTSSYLMLEGSAQAELRRVLFDAYAQRDHQWVALQLWATENAERFPWLVVLLEWRTRTLERGHTIRTWFGLVSELLRADDRFPWSISVSEGDANLRRRDTYAKNRMEQCLANEISVALTEDMQDISFTRFVDWCEQIWNAAEVLVPPADFGIPVVSNSESFLGSDVVLVLGMLEGSFPRRRSEDSTLFDEDLRKLSELQPELPAMPNSHDKAHGERQEFYRLCAQASRQIIFSYPSANEDSDSIPAFYLEAVKEVLEPRGLLKQVTHLRTEWTPPLDEAILDADRNLAVAAVEAKPQILDNRLESEAARELMERVPADGYSPDELADAIECPFHFLSRHQLKLRPKRTTVRWGLLRSIPADVALTTITDLDRARNLMQLQLQAKLSDFYSELPPWEAKFLAQGGTRLIERWLRREQVRRELWADSLGPEILKGVRFGQEHTRSQLKGVPMRGRFGAIYDLGSYRVGQLNEGPQPNAESLKHGLNDHDHLWVGLHVAALSSELRDVALDIEGTGARRTLLLMPARTQTEDNWNYTPSQNTSEGLYVLQLSGTDLLNGTSAQFKTKTIELLEKAKQTIQEAKPVPRPGTHCGRCHYGELCRKSTEFVEEATLFEEDSSGN